jgi:hypothetical protein
MWPRTGPQCRRSRWCSGKWVGCTPLHTSFEENATPQHPTWGDVELQRTLNNEFLGDGSDADKSAVAGR